MGSEEKSTDQLARELQEIMRSGALRGPTTSTALIRKSPPADAPKFGDIYFGALDYFAKGKPHYGMVTRRNRGRDKAAFAPITDGNNNFSKSQYIVVLPEKTLPPKRKEKGMEFIPSHILLRITVWITVERIQNDSQFRYIDRLESQFREEAREKLAALWPPELSKYLA
jgi:hypothetical protein